MLKKREKKKPFQSSQANMMMIPACFLKPTLPPPISVPLGVGLDGAQQGQLNNTDVEGCSGPRGEPQALSLFDLQGGQDYGCFCKQRLFLLSSAEQILGFRGGGAARCCRTRDKSRHFGQKGREERIHTSWRGAAISHLGILIPLNKCKCKTMCGG